MRNPSETFEALLADNDALKRREVLYHKMIDEVEDYAIILLDVEGVIQNWNKGAQKIKQYLASEAIGKSFEIFYLPEDRASGLPLRLLTEAKINGKAIDEGWRLRKDTSRFWASVTLTAIHDDKGEVIGLTKVTRDLTDKKRMDDDAKRAAMKIRQSNEALQRSEDRYLRMIREIEDYAIILLNENGDIQNWNFGAEKIKGYSSEEIIGKNFRIFYLPDDRASGLPERLLNEAAETGKAIHEGLRLRKDGTTFWGSIVITALHDDKGRVIGFSKVTRDLTDRKQAEDLLVRSAAELRQANEALKKSEERYQRMIAEVKDYAIILLNERAEIQNWNAGAERIKGYSASEILAKHFRIFYLPHDRASGLPERLIQEAINTGRAVHEGWRMRKDGTRFWGSIVITSLHNDNGEVIGFSKVTRDLTEKKHAEDKLKEYLQELESQNRELEQFAYVASHDLQEPLRKMQTFVEIIDRNYTDETLTRKFFHKIRASAERMTDLVKSILNYSRLLREGQNRTDCDLNDVLRDVLMDFDLMIEEKGAIITHDTLPVLTGVPTQLNQLFSNLLGNALKFSVALPKVHIGYRLVADREVVQMIPDPPAGMYHEVIFSDNGIGFDQQYVKLIFTMFQRLHRKDEFSGTGIGLALCKKIMENHRGYIAATGVPGEGATFYLYFPEF